MSWNEMTVSYASERSIDGYWHAIRLFRVVGHPRKDILANLGSITRGNSPTDPFPTGLNWDDTLPEILGRANRDSVGQPDADELNIGDNIRVFAYNAVTIPTEVPLITDVEIRYTNDPRLIASKVEDQLSFQTSDMQLPVAIKSARAAFGGPPKFWTITTMPFRFTVGRLQQTVLLSNSEVPTCRLASLTQTNALHSLPIDLSNEVNENLVFRFEGADIARYSPSYYMVRYSWQFDGGHRELFRTSSPQVALEYQMPPNELTFFTDGSIPVNVNIRGVWVRPPYYSLEGMTLLQEDPGGNSSTVPVWFGVRGSPYSGVGWTVLPGVTFP
jgi:hypothetical protein